MLNMVVIDDKGWSDKGWIQMLMTWRTLDAGIGAVGTSNDPNDPFYGHLCFDEQWSPHTW